MIRSFADKDTERLFKRASVRKFQGVEHVALRKLRFLQEAKSLHDFKGPGFQLEKVTGDRAGQHSIRVSDKWGICFVWKDGEAHDVEITDYH